MCINPIFIPLEFLEFKSIPTLFCCNAENESNADIISAELQFVLFDTWQKKWIMFRHENAIQFFKSNLVAYFKCLSLLFSFWNQLPTIQL